MANEAEIAHLENLLNSGIRSNTNDGQTTVFDPDSARRRLAELKAANASQTWPRTSTIKLSSGFEDL